MPPACWSANNTNKQLDQRIQALKIRQNLDAQFSGFDGTWADLFDEVSHKVFFNAKCYPITNINSNVFGNLN